MKCLRITAARQAEYAELPTPSPGPGEALLRVAWVGMCGSDLLTWRGINPLASYPRIPGHEVSGTVVALGFGSQGVAIGDQALVIPYLSCGRCSACRVGRTNTCRDNRTLGVQRDGALATLIVAPVDKLMKVVGLDLRGLAMVEPLSVGFHAAARGRVTAGEVVAIIGCGAVGIGAVAGAVARGAHVIAVDVDDRKLALARSLGASDTIRSDRVDVTEALAALAGGEGPAVLIEAAGQAITFRACVEAASFAGRVVYIGYTKEPVAYETKRIVQKELDVLGSRNAMREDFAAAAGWLLQDPTRVNRLVSHQVPFAASAAALANWDSAPGEVSKILVDCSAG